MKSITLIVRLLVFIAFFSCNQLEQFSSRNKLSSHKNKVATLLPRVDSKIISKPIEDEFVEVEIDDDLEGEITDGYRWVSRKNKVFNIGRKVAEGGYYAGKKGLGMGCYLVGGGTELAGKGMQKLAFIPNKIIKETTNFTGDIFEIGSNYTGRAGKYVTKKGFEALITDESQQENIEGCSSGIENFHKLVGYGANQVVSGFGKYAGKGTEEIVKLTGNVLESAGKSVREYGERFLENEIENTTEEDSPLGVPTMVDKEEESKSNSFWDSIKNAFSNLFSKKS